MQKKRISPNRNSLAAEQHEAIRLLASGCTAKYTALVLKLDYATVRRWLKQDLPFQSELAAQIEKQCVHPPDLPSQPEQKKRPIAKKRRANPVV